MINANIEKMLALLTQLLGIYRDLLNLAGQKQAALVNHNVPELEKIIAAEQQLVLRGRKTEEARQQLQAEIVDQSGNPAAEATLSQLIAIAEPEQAAQLTALQQSFDDLLGRLKTQNELNAQLVQQGLSFIDYTVELLTQAGPEDATYSEHGEQDGKQVRQLFDSKA